ncbi:AtpZ/AtpI family protein [Algoriphagus lutimaris]|uniref:AtpZ/AtpI family protein n=1 Tax=Algoriphagus lutimaris TaxID=613197 RepID=UPI00196ABA80|nr:AtpZ/AtpI family protein [Algoriphagus lutimaris]MBN3521529.1 AtpZ/AtpI family protein [Algoriphagus lutimaris]
MESQKPANKDSKDNKTPVFVKYIGLSFQLFGIIGAGTFLGWWIQSKSDMKFPIWLLLCCFASIAIAFYQLWNMLRQDE